MAKRRRTSRRKPADPPREATRELISDGPGAGDWNSGGGAGTGIPDAELAMRTDAATRGDVERDRKKLFPRSGGTRRSSRRRPATRAGAAEARNAERNRIAREGAAVFPPSPGTPREGRGEGLPHTSVQRVTARRAPTELTSRVDRRRRS